LRSSVLGFACGRRGPSDSGCARMRVPNFSVKKNSPRQPRHDAPRSCETPNHLAYGLTGLWDRFTGSFCGDRMLGTKCPESIEL
jgi:hypothetical protein